MSEEEIYKLLGREGFEKITHHFYVRMKEDDLVGKMYPDDDWEGAEERLCDFLLFRFGGVKDYWEKRGHPRLRMRHAPYLIGEKESARWVEIMDGALIDAEVPKEIAAQLHEFFAGVADFMRNH